MVVSADPIATPVFRAEVVGSLLRPERLCQAAQQHADGRLSDADLREAQSAAIADALVLQAQCGLDVCTDGEMRRGHFADPLLSGLHCFGSAPGAQEPWHDQTGAVQVAGDPRAVTAKLDFTGCDEIDSYRFAATHATLPIKVTVPSPTALLSRYVPEVSGQAYPNPLDLFRDTAEILTGVIGELAHAGCRYIQFDAPELTAVVDAEMRDSLHDKGISPDELVDTACELMNAITDRTPGVKFAVHLCRGNMRGLWRKRGGYEALSTTFFTRLRGVDTFMLEFDDERSGTFECLSELPEDKVAVLGLITTKNGSLESRDAITTRLHAAAEHVPLERLALSTQCGFASTAEGNPITAEQQRRKLELVAEAARLVWPAD